MVYAFEDVGLGHRLRRLLALFSDAAMRNNE
jgi:hypothetical protein